MESLGVDSRHRIQALREGLAKGSQPQPTKGWAVTEKVFDSLQFILQIHVSGLISQCPVIKSAWIRPI